MIVAVGVVVPAHDEQDLLPRCLAALGAAVATLTRRPHPPRVHVVVALDACSDASARIAHEAGVHTVVLQARNVGRARSAGIDRVLGLEPATSANRIWLANTDADSVVPPHWLTRQLDLAAAGAAAVLGTVEPDEWEGHAAGVAASWAARYHRGQPHDHVHAANLGCTAAAYNSAGGFGPLRTGEDRALLQALGGHHIHRVTDPVVRTSTRRYGRAPDGFARYLRELAP